MIDKRVLYESLVDAYHADIFRYLRWMAKDVELAEDLTQEAYTRAWKYLDKLADPTKAKSWLYQIARNELHRHMGRKQHPTIGLDDIDDPLDGGATPEMVATQEALLDAMESLDLIYREPLLLQLLGGFDGNEIATILGVERATVTMRVFRAKRKVQALCSSAVSRTPAATRSVMS